MRPRADIISFTIFALVMGLFFTWYVWTWLPEQCKTEVYYAKEMIDFDNATGGTLHYEDVLPPDYPNLELVREITDIG